MKIFTLLILGMVCLFLPTFNSYGQQDPLYSQYMFNPLAFNPSYAGIHNNTNITLNSRFQWTSFDGSPNTQTLSASTSILNGKVGLGVTFIYDELGTNTNSQGQFSYAYKIQQADKTFSFGLQTGFMTIKLDDSALNLKVDDDPFFLGGTESATKVNFGVGASYMTSTYFVSISVPRLINSKFESNNVNIEYQRHLYLTGAYLFDINPGLKIKPSILLKQVKGAPLSTDININALIANKIWAGLFTRNFNTYGVIAQFDFMEAYKIGYSFEVLGNDFSGSRLPTHEIILSADIALFTHQSVYRRFF